MKYSPFEGSTRVDYASECLSFTAECVQTGPNRYRVKARGRHITYWMPDDVQPGQYVTTPGGSLVVTEERIGRLDWFYLPRLD